MSDVALVGYGHWGRNLARAFHELNALRGICDVLPDHLGEARTAYPNVESFPSLDPLLTRGDIQAIVLATPATTHYSLARRALAAAKDVYVEKPFTLSSVDASDLVLLAEQRERIVMVGHLLAYEPALNTLQELDLGDIQHIKCERFQYGKVRVAENVLWSLAPHDVSIILYLLQRPCRRVLCLGQAMVQPGVHDWCICHLDFGDGVTATVHVNWLESDRRRRVWVKGSHEIAVWDDFDIEHKVKVWPRGRATGTGDVILPMQDGDPRTPPVEVQPPLQAMCRQFLRALDDRRSPRNDGHDGLRVVRILEAAQRSLDAGSTWQSV